MEVPFIALILMFESMHVNQDNARLAGHEINFFSRSHLAPKSGSPFQKVGQLKKLGTMGGVIKNAKDIIIHLIVVILKV